MNKNKSANLNCFVIRLEPGIITDLDENMGLQGQYFDPQDRNASPESLDYQDLAAHMNETVPIQVEVGISV